MAACVVNDADFTTAGGGCQDLGTGLVWGPDMRAQGLAFPSTTGVGIAACASCIQDACDRNLNQQPQGGGFTDWRAPTVGEVQAALANGLNSHLDFFNDGGATPDDGAYRWTACTKKVKGANNIYAVRYTDGAVRLDLVGGNQLICVRGRAADTANDCPGPGKKKNALSQTSAGAVMLLPLAVVLAARCLRPRRP
jgi:hypothetical protein